MDYFEKLSEIIYKVEVTQIRRAAISLDKVIPKVASLIITADKKGNKLIFVGNGGSASIASHAVTDLLKNAEVSAVTFSDPSLLTCVSNDLGYENVFRKPVEVLARKDDIMFAISSSGKSQNILNAAVAAKNKGCFLITLSGFKKDNPLRKLGDINFYVPSDSYGYVEIIHLIICHWLIDYVMEGKEKRT
jgi:D-sedoheptulose 7-phosphate isomerase